jgi:hypothetical protein
MSDQENKKMKIYEEITKRLAETSETRRIVRDISNQAAEEEPENFLFVAAGSGKIIKGMHYPDSAFIDGQYPLLYKTAEDNIIIAAWPRNYLREMMIAIEENNPEKYWDSEWNKFLQVLVDKSVEMMKNVPDVTEGLL